MFDNDYDVTSYVQNVMDHRYLWNKCQLTYWNKNYGFVHSHVCK